MVFIECELLRVDPGYNRLWADCFLDPFGNGWHNRLQEKPPGKQDHHVPHYMPDAGIYRDDYPDNP